MSNRKRFFLLPEIGKYLVSLAILGAGAGVLLVLINMAKKPTNVPPTALIPLVKTFDAAPYSGQLDMEVSGTVVPFREVQVAAEVAGRISIKHPECEAGTFVKKGWSLLEIDKADLDLDLKSTQADIQQAEKGIEEVVQDIVGAEENLKLSENDYALQKADYDRNVRLKSAISEAELNTSERNLLAAKSALVSIKNNILSLKARKAKLEATLEFTKTKLDRIYLNIKRAVIKAPVDGVIVREMTEQGNVVSMGERLLVLEDTSRSEVLCNLTTTDLNWIRENSGEDVENIEIKGIADVYRMPKTNVTIFDSSEPDVRWEGVLERFDGIGRDEVTKTFPCRIVVKNPVVDTKNGKRALVRGMYVKCQIEVYNSAGSDKREFLTFPTIGLRPGSYIWIARDRKLKRIDVEVVDHTVGNLNGKSGEPFVIVKQLGDGLAAGDKIVITPLSQPLDGGPVQFSSDLNSSVTEPAVTNAAKKTGKNSKTASDPNSKG